MSDTHYNAALYMRISKDDKTQKESESIETQRKILNDFCTAKGFAICGEYIDDGFSGTDYKNRPAFLRLIDDINSKKINLVITKDLSRLGRNSAETGYLLDTVFPQKKVRYISVCESIDTNNRDSSYNLITPVFNFTNELYCADISNKIRSALEIKMKNGEFIGSFAPFGYKKDEKNKNRLIPDKPAAEIVRQIFSLAKSRYSSYEIALMLNQKQTPTPSAYKNNGRKISHLWTSSSVLKILNNGVYLGHTEQKKTQKPGFKSTKSFYVPKDKHIIVKNTHEALIDADTWSVVHTALKSRRKSANTGFVNIFSGIAFCADCKTTMSSAVSGKNAYLVCGKYKQHGKNCCTSHRILYKFLYDMVLKTLKDEFLLSDNEKTEMANEIVFEKTAGLNKSLNDAKQKLTLINNKITNLLDDKYSGNICHFDFKNIYKKYTSQKNDIETEILTAETALKKTNVSLFQSAFNLIENAVCPKELSPEILHTFIDKIYIYNPNPVNDKTKYKIEIYFKHADNKF